MDYDEDSFEDYKYDEEEDTNNNENNNAANYEYGKLYESELSDILQEPN